MTARNVTRLTNTHDRSDLYAHVQVGRGPTSVPLRSQFCNRTVGSTAHHTCTQGQAALALAFKLQLLLTIERFVCWRWGSNSNYCSRLSALCAGAGFKFQLQPTIERFVLALGSNSNYSPRLSALCAGAGVQIPTTAHD